MSEYCIGIDLGGTAAKMGLFETTGQLLHKWNIKTDISDHGAHILPDIRASLKEELRHFSVDEAKVKGIGIGIPGPVIGDGIVSASVNLGWYQVHVKEQLSGLTGLPVKVANDANVATLGEMWQGSGKGYKNLVMITLGTGIGGGVIIGERIVSGLFGAAGEFGHMPIVQDEPDFCNCGRKGCLEQAASATGIVKEAKRRLEKKTEPSLLENRKDLTAKDVFDAAHEGDSLALGVIDRAARYLGIAMACVTGVVDPDVFLIGGGVAAAGKTLLEPLERYYRENVLFLSKETPIRLATLRNDAGIYGAARMVLE